MSKRLLITISVVVLLVVSTTAAFIIGALLTERRFYHRQYLEEREIVAPIIASDDVFRDIELYEVSSGGIGLMGNVPTDETKQRLFDEVAEAIGKKRADELTLGISKPKDEQ